MLWEQVLRAWSSCVNASILHITCSGGERIVLSFVFWPRHKLWFSREPINWVRNASSITSPGISLSVKNHHKGLFELWACFTKVWLPSSSISSGWCQTSSQGFEILRRTVLPAPAPFRSIELFRLGRWALCHTAESFNKPTWVGNILDRVGNILTWMGNILDRIIQQQCKT